MSATRSLLERRDVIIVASVSCIYGLGSPEAYYGMMLLLQKGQSIAREAILRKLVEIQYERSRGFRRGGFRVRGDMIEIYPPYEDYAFALEMWGSQIEAIRKIDPAHRRDRTGGDEIYALPIYPKSHYVLPAEQRERAIQGIYEELEWWKGELDKQGKIVESQRIVQRTHVRYRDDADDRLLPRDRKLLAAYVRPACRAKRRRRCWITFRPTICFSSTNRTRPCRSCMRCIAGDRSRKQTLVNYGFRMPSALDNRPLTFEEFEHRTNQVVYVSATPGPYELTKVGGVVAEQVIRPTGLVDPEVEIRPVKGQVDDLLEQIRIRTARNERVLVTTLTKRMSEDLAEYFAEVGIRCRVFALGNRNARTREDFARSAARRVRCTDWH